jgi:crotonobetainyl-CoA:carnitine CoA-transferase CaiB-like acyl-CoA transferase
MLATFRHYNIIPIFVFDGKPPAEKTELLKKRKEEKLSALNEYNQMKSQLNAINNEEERKEMLSNMELLKRTFVHLDIKQIQQVKQMIRAYGATYYDAPCEADELCAMLVIQNKVWACLSEDMDMFVYGCTRVLRYLSLANHTVVFYDLKGILTELEITQQNLREICVLSGTDYNTNNDNNTLHATLKMFKKFMRTPNKNPDVSFYEWLRENTKCISDYELLQKIYAMFDLSVDHDRLAKFEQVSICNGPINHADIREILKTEGFVF